MSTLPLLSPRQAAEEMGLSLSRIKQFCAEGRIGQRVGKRWVILRDELEQFQKIPRPHGKALARKSNGAKS